MRGKQALVALHSDEVVESSELYQIVEYISGVIATINSLDESLAIHTLTQSSTHSTPRAASTAGVSKWRYVHPCQCHPSCS